MTMSRDVRKLTVFDLLTVLRTTRCPIARYVIAEEFLRRHLPLPLPW